MSTETSPAMPAFNDHQVIECWVDMPSSIIAGVRDYNPDANARVADSQWFTGFNGRFPDWIKAGAIWDHIKAAIEAEVPVLVILNREQTKRYVFDAALVGNVYKGITAEIAPDWLMPHDPRLSDAQVAALHVERHHPHFHKVHVSLPPIEGALSVSDRTGKFLAPRDFEGMELKSVDIGFDSVATAAGGSCSVKAESVSNTRPLVAAISFGAANVRWLTHELTDPQTVRPGDMIYVQVDGIPPTGPAPDADTPAPSTAPSGLHATLIFAPA